MPTASLDTAGCTTLNATQPELATLGQKAVQLKIIKSLLIGKKETSDDTPHHP
jgi:hypothetical protein